MKKITRLIHRHVARSSDNRPRFFAEPLEPRRLLDSTTVINELMYQPHRAEASEWVELHNQMAVDMDLSQWRFSTGVEFTFPEGTILPGGGYLVIAANPAKVQQDYGLTVSLALGRDRLPMAVNDWSCETTMIA